MTWVAQDVHRCDMHCSAYHRKVHGIRPPTGASLPHQRGVNGGKAFVWGLPCTEYRAGMEHWEVLLGSLTLVQSVCLIHHMMNVKRHLNLKCPFHPRAARGASSDGGVCISYILVFHLKDFSSN